MQSCLSPYLVDHSYLTSWHFSKSRGYCGCHRWCLWQWTVPKAGSLLQLVSFGMWSGHSVVSSGGGGWTLRCGDGACMQCWLLHIETCHGGWDRSVELTNMGISMLCTDQSLGLAYKTWRICRLSGERVLHKKETRLFGELLACSPVRLCPSLNINIYHQIIKSSAPFIRPRHVYATRQTTVTTKTKTGVRPPNLKGSKSTVAPRDRPRRLGRPPGMGSITREYEPFNWLQRCSSTYSHWNCGAEKRRKASSCYELNTIDPAVLSVTWLWESNVTLGKALNGHSIRAVFFVSNVKGARYGCLWQIADSGYWILCN